MAKVTYKDLSPEMNRMIAPRTFAAGRSSVGMEGSVGEFYYISIEYLVPFRNQARQKFDEVELNQLADSIKEVGVRQPLSVVAIPDKQGYYEVISGERRLRAAKIAGLSKVPCLIVREHDKVDEIALIENVQRSDLHPVELGRALKILMIQKNHGGQRELAQTLGLSESSVSELLSVASLPDDVLTMMISKNIKSREIIRQILKIKDKNEMISLLSLDSFEKRPSLSSTVHDPAAPDELSLDEEKKTSIQAAKSVLRISLKNHKLKVQSKGIKGLSQDEKIEMIEVLEYLIKDVKSSL